MNNKLNLTWKDVFNSQRMWPMDFNQCREWVEKTGYKYLAFNGEVFRVDDIKMKNVICVDSELDKLSDEGYYKLLEESYYDNAEFDEYMAEKLTYVSWQVDNISKGD